MSTVELTQEYLKRRYQDELARVDEIASEVGCSVANIRKRIKDWRLLRGKALWRAGKVRSWNEGLTKHDDTRLAALAESHSGAGNPMAGKVAWNAGLTAEVDARIASVSSKLTGRAVDESAREKMAAAKRGKVREQSNRWRGGTTKIGPYTEFRKTVDGRRVYVHRWVAEQSLGRLLARDEHVHHVDRDEGNNAPVNLLVLSEADHAKLHGAIYRGECDTRAEQIEWLTRAQIPFLEIQ